MALRAAVGLILHGIGDIGYVPLFIGQADTRRAVLDHSVVAGRQIDINNLVSENMIGRIGDPVDGQRFFAAGEEAEVDRLFPVACHGACLQRLAHNMPAADRRGAVTGCRFDRAAHDADVTEIAAAAAAADCRSASAADSRDDPALDINMIRAEDGISLSFAADRRGAKAALHDQTVLRRAGDAQRARVFAAVFLYSGAPSAADQVARSGDLHGDIRRAVILDFKSGGEIPVLIVHFGIDPDVVEHNVRRRILFDHNAVRGGGKGVDIADCQLRRGQDSELAVSRFSGIALFKGIVRPVLAARHDKVAHGRAAFRSGGKRARNGSRR